MRTYSFDIFAKSGIAPQANAVVYGIESGFFLPSVASLFEEYMIECCDAEESIDLLAFEGSAEEAVQLLAAAGFTDNGQGKDTLRLAILGSLDSKGQKLLEEIESIYSDFDYPSEMDGFIYYMPNDEGPTSVDVMVARFHSFLASERNRLGIGPKD